MKVNKRPSNCRRSPDPKPIIAARKEIEATSDGERVMRAMLLNTEASERWMSESTTKKDMAHMQKCSAKAKSITLEHRSP